MVEKDHRHSEREQIKEKLENAARDIAEYVTGAPADSGKRVAFFDHLALIEANRDFEQNTKYIFKDGKSSEERDPEVSIYTGHGESWVKPVFSGDFRSSNTKADSYQQIPYLSKQDVYAAIKLADTEKTITEHKGSVDGYPEAYEELKKRMSLLVTLLDSSFKAKKRNYEMKEVVIEAGRIFVALGGLAFSSRGDCVSGKEGRFEIKKILDLKREIAKEKIREIGGIKLSLKMYGGYDAQKGFYFNKEKFREALLIKQNLFENYSEEELMEIQNEISEEDGF